MGGLVLVATPIGNLGDLSPRAADVLRTAELWIVEDSRISGKLASHLGVSKPMKVLNDHTNPAQVERLAHSLSDGGTVALLTDGGMPVISDPGTLLIERAIGAGVPVTAVPGPSAPVTALAVSGFFGQRFAFLGFLGRKPKDIRQELRPFAESALTLVLFESPHRIDHLLAVAAEVLGPRRYAVCRELTKMFEQVYRDRLPSVPTEEQLPRKGEITLVIEGVRKNQPIEP